MKLTSILTLGIFAATLTQAAPQVLQPTLDTMNDFWQPDLFYDTNPAASWSNRDLVYAGNSAFSQNASESIYKDFGDYDELGMIIEYDVSGLSPAAVNAPGFQALLDVQFQGYSADYNRYGGSFGNPDPKETDGNPLTIPGARDKKIYLDVYPMLEQYEFHSHRFLRNGTNPTNMLGWDNVVPALNIAAVKADGTNFNDAFVQLGDTNSTSPVDQIIFTPGWNPRTFNAVTTGSGALEWAGGVDAATSGPVHLGKSGAYNSVLTGTGMSGATFIGDGVDNQNYGVVLAFDFPSSEEVDDALWRIYDEGKTVFLTGETLVSGSSGDLSWADLFVTVQAYGNRTTGTLGPAEVGNLDPTDPLTDATYSYTVVTPLTFIGDPMAGDTSFIVDITSAVAALPLDTLTNNRLMVGIFARKDGDGSGTGYAGSNFDNLADVIEFDYQQFKLTVQEFADATQPNTHGELVFDVTSLVQDWVNGVIPNHGFFIHVNKDLSWGEQINFNTAEREIPGVLALGEGTPLLRVGEAPAKPPLEATIATPDFNIDVDSQLGYFYQLQVSNDGMASWQDVGDSVEGTGAVLPFVGSAPAAPGDKVFYRVTASLAP